MCALPAAGSGVGRQEEEGPPAVHAPRRCRYRWRVRSHVVSHPRACRSPPSVLHPTPPPPAPVDTVKPSPYSPSMAPRSKRRRRLAANLDVAGVDPTRFGPGRSSAGARGAGRTGARREACDGARPGGAAACAQSSSPLYFISFFPFNPLPSLLFPPEPFLSLEYGLRVDSLKVEGLFLQNSPTDEKSRILSWRAAPARRLPSGFGTRPWLIQAHGSCKDTQTLVDMPDRSLHEATHDCFLLSVTSRTSKISLPPLRPTTEYKGATCGVLGSPANFTVVIVSEVEAESEQKFMLCCCPGDEDWTDLTAADDYLRFSGTIVSHAGKLYAGNLVVTDVIDGAVRSRFLDTEGKVEAMHGSTASYLVVSSGDIFSVWITYLGRPYDGSLIKIVVRRRELSDLVWTRVESIGSDCAFLLSGDYGLSCSAAAAGMQGNCIYLVWSSCDCERLYKFCLDDMTKSFHQILPNPTSPCSSIQTSGFKGQALQSAPRPPTSNE
uniref:KIB1-4 beta-propeller domain-containing protein n=1 Tax=Setaria italica TaxID=4555 RepID=A0A0Q3V375_SETIT